MRKFVPLDSDSGVSQENWAVVTVPKRSRNRFGASSVEICTNSKDAVAQACPENRRFAAKVIGPSKSSEGQIIYYLMHWLTSKP